MLRGTRAAAGVLAAAVLTTVAFGAVGPAQATTTGWQQHRLRLGVPAYWSPDTADGNAMFTQLVYAVPAVDLVILNGPDSAPPTPYDPQAAATIARLHREGATVLGYVDSGYLGLTGNATTRVNPGSTALSDWVAQVAQDVGDWYRLYGAAGLDGVFVDQTPSTCGTDESYLHAYQSALRGLHGQYRGAMVAMNPGTNTDECYTDVADALVVFENSYAAYLDWSPPAWAADHPETDFWHLVYGVPTAAEMADAVALARQRGARHVYVTDRSPAPGAAPWTTLPAYWDEELRLVAGAHHTA